MNELAFAWHVHHNVLVEPLTGSIESRRDYITANKPTSEHETRLRLLKPVLGALPTPVVEAGRVYEEAGRACGEAGRAYKMIQVHQDAINALHARECPDCPWDGKTIFPKKEQAI